MKRALLAATILMFPLTARAQPVTGLYVGAGAGGNFMQDKIVSQHFLGPQVANSRLFVPFDAGFAGVASVGFGFGNGFRVEAEGDYRYNKFRGSSGSRPHEDKYGGMANVLFDFDIGSPWIWPYVGAGAGYMAVHQGRDGSASSGDQGTFAYQGIAGVSVPIPWLVGLSATLEYRFLGLSGIKRDDTGPVSFGGTVVPDERVSIKSYNNLNHSVLLGLRYAFYVPPPPPPPAPAVTAPPAVQPARSYLVFFDWDRADLTTRARQIIAEAAKNIGRVQHTRIEVDGHADRSGTPQYNQRLSIRRAETVAAELVRLGVARAEIDIHGYGDTRPLVPTAAGVREPQNRRVEIIIR